MNPQAIPLIKRMLKLLNLSDTRPLVDRALKKTTARGVYDLLREAYGDLMTEQLYPE
jgi:hypothetical protein